MSFVNRSTCLMALVSALFALNSGCASAPVRSGGPPALTAQETAVVSQGLTDASVRYTGQITGTANGVVERADYELVADGQVVKTGSAKLGVPFAPGTPADFSIEEKSSYVKSPEDLARLSAQGGTVLIALRGTLVVRSGGSEETVPFAASRAVRVPRLPEVIVESLDAARYSPEEVQINLRLGVRNPNPFPLRLDSLTYQVAVADKPLEEGTTAQADSVDASATGVYPVEVAVTAQSWGPGVKALIGKGVLPYSVKGELKGPLLQVPYFLKGDVKLNVSR
ncbi:MULTISPECIES: LEA type 2 family protein [unclassified Corallococcus]|uniref:LEA type 2 family protein n=1 Tax=unclassified Corallococcus TaxID=2685029 RepID=UPI001A8C6EA4|nr:MULTISPECIES: LEA type 2 family protein [unclassified Corallococcus]MBN9688001.1 LEA type 2 family protein [Corallococcus sp. NCSPR001]WAS88189.1 LEA type 2 family protein [Corallococcus sp. NCRR]